MVVNANVTESLNVDICVYCVVTSLSEQSVSLIAVYCLIIISLQFAFFHN